MSKEKSTSGGKSAPVKPSKGGASGSRSLGESTSPINKGGKFNQTTTGSTGPKDPAKKK